MNKKFIFMCPHGAAKSLLAMHYFKHLTKDSELNVSVSNAGTEPDPAPNPKVVEYLRALDIDVSGQEPTRFTTEELQSADRVLSIGCDLHELAKYTDKLESWDEVPMMSEDFDGAVEAIKARVEKLIEEIST
jgi:protein-tyrosine-phosphatase